MERSAGVRRHGDDPAAADRSALQGQVGPRAPGPLPGRARSVGPGDRPRLLAAAVSCRAISSPSGARPSRPVSIAGTAQQAQDASRPRSRKSSCPRRSTADPEGLEIVFRPDPTIWDGRFANNGWLQELPKPLTKLSWDNAALLSPALARRLGSRERRCGRAAISRYDSADSGLDHAGPGRTNRSPSSWDTGAGEPAGSAPGRRRRLRPAHLGRALVRLRTRDRQDGRAPPPGAPCIITSAWRAAT